MPCRIGAMNKGNAGYFHFPLCLLAFVSDYKERLDYIVCYCLYEHSQRLKRSFPKLSANDALSEAARFLNVNMGSYQVTRDKWRVAIAFILQWEARYGRDASVRIATALLWEAYNNTGLTYREFSILCAINSIIGNRRSSPRRITEPSIRIRAAGFKSWTVANRELGSDESRKMRLLTPDQVRYTLERLHARKFFARARVGARTVKYMIGVSDAELRVLLLRRQTYYARFRRERAEKDRELMLAIRSANQVPAHDTLAPQQITPVALESVSHDTNRDMIANINSSRFNSSTYE